MNKHLLSRIVRGTLEVTKVFLIGFALVIIIGLSLAFYFRPSCGRSENEIVPLPNTNWSIVSEDDSCIGYTDVVAKNKLTTKEQDLIRFSYFENVRLAVKNDEILISVRNLAEVVSKTDKFEGHEILVNYTPHDDPAERKNFLFWLGHSNDPRAEEWHRKWIGEKTEQE